MLKSAALAVKPYYARDCKDRSHCILGVMRISSGSYGGFRVLAENFKGDHGEPSNETKVSLSDERYPPVAAGRDRAAKDGIPSCWHATKAVTWHTSAFYRQLATLIRSPVELGRAQRGCDDA